MGSDFRSKKIIQIYKYFDKDESKFIDKKDFEITAQYIANQRGWQPGDAKYKDIQDSMAKVWTSLQKHADKDNDGQVSLDEWMTMWDEFAKNPSSPLEWQSIYCKLNFDYQAGEDGVIDLDEYTRVAQGFGVDKDVAVDCFKKISKGKSSVSWEDYQELWKDFFVSNDPDAPGNYIFGPVRV